MPRVNLSTRQVHEAVTALRREAASFEGAASASRMVNGREGEPMAREYAALAKRLRGIAEKIERALGA